MPKYLIRFVVPHYGEIEIDADSLEEAKSQAKWIDPSEADWDLLDDVSDADIASVDEITGRDEEWFDF